MPGATVVDLDGDLQWLDYEIPNSSTPVAVAILREGPSRARTLAVRFPKDWERPSAGWYSAAEEFVVLAGTLEMNGEIYKAGDYSYVPAGTTRVGSLARSETLTVARFDGPARWNPGSAGDTDSLLRRELSAGSDAVASPLGDGRAWLLRNGADGSAWLLDAPAAGSASPCHAELVALDARTFTFVPAGARFEDLEGLCFCRTFDGEGDSR